MNATRRALLAAIAIAPASPAWTADLPRRVGFLGDTWARERVPAALDALGWQAGRNLQLASQVGGLLVHSGLGVQVERKTG